MNSLGSSSAGGSHGTGGNYHSTGVSSGSLRRASEENRYRAFLSSHFDAQAYVTNIIKEGKSEEYFTQIGSCIKEVDDEIKSYISAHKHELMSGMQDVAALATRYQELESTAQKLRNTIDKMQREASESYESVRTRTVELERIHETSSLLKQLKQFNHAKAQIDHYTKDAKDLTAQGDLRQYSTMAKIIQELETLLRSPALSALSIVKSQVENIKRLGSQIRSASQERLLVALDEQNQATVAECLQVFYNLKSLPEIILLAIDMTVKSTADIASAAIDLNLLLNETPSQVASAPQSSSGGSSVIKRALEQSMTTSNPSPQSILLPNAAQLRVAMKEMCHHWAASTQEQATKIHVLQRVIAHKEDPSTHEKFLDVLHSIHPSSPDSVLLAAGRLVDVFWVRLSSSLQDVIADKVRTSTLAATRVYPTIRKASFELYNNLRVMSGRDSAHHNPFSLAGISKNQIGSFDPVDLLSVSTAHRDANDEDYEDSEDESRESNFGRKKLGGWHRSSPEKVKSIGLFGSLITTSTPYYVNGPTSISTALNLVYQKEKKFSQCVAEGEANAEEFKVEDMENDVISSLLAALSPMRDRYLSAALNKMNDPVLQMFSESEGYSAAIPSKRDLQTLVKTIQDEISCVVIESDRGLVKIIGREAAKTIRLFLTKVENMTVNGDMTSSNNRIISIIGIESMRISFHNNQFHRTNPQDHNKQLIVLLHQLQEILDKLVTQVVKATRDAPGTALAFGLHNKGTDHSSQMEAILKAELAPFFEACNKHITDLTTLLLTPLVNSLEEYFREILLGLLKEGITVSAATVTPNKNNGPTPSSGCSRAVDTVLIQFPLALDTYLLSLPRTAPVIAAAQRLTTKVLLTFTSIASLRRPINEQSRLLTATEISALDMMTTSLSAVNISCQCFPSLDDALNELRSYRRLLFDAEISCRPSDLPQGAGGFGDLGSNLIPAPAELLFSLSYLSSVRSSTLLGYLLSAGPRQIPSPLEHYLSTFHQTSMPSSYISLILSIDDVTTHSTAAYPSFRQRMAKSQGEKKSIDIIRSCLDVFVQRISVIEDTSQKNLLKLWYESLTQVANYASSG